MKGVQGGGPSRGANSTRNSTMRVGQETGWWGGPRGRQLPPDCVPGCDSVIDWGHYVYVCGCVADGAFVGLFL